MPLPLEILRSLVEQGQVEREDLEETAGDPAEIVENVLARKAQEWFLAHPGSPSNLIPGETDPEDRPDYSIHPI